MRKLFVFHVLFTRCPLYYNLPPQCKLVKKGNGCCLEPVCDFQGTHGTTNGQFVGKYNGVSKSTSLRFIQ